MKTKGLELNVNELVEQIVKLAEDKVDAQWEADKIKHQRDGWESKYHATQKVLKQYEDKLGIINKGVL